MIELALRFVVEAEQPRDRVDKLLAKLMAPVSRATVQRWIEEGRVRVDGRSCRARDAVGPGCVIEVDPGPPPASAAEPDPSVAFAVLYEDAHIVVVDKPPGLVVHPARGHATGTLVNGLLSRTGFESAAADPRDPSGALRPGIVHRIDKDTSGVLVVAKQADSREALKSQIAARSVERRYLALVLGVPRDGRIATLYGRHPTSRLRFSSRVLEGRTAITNVRVLERLAGGRAALVECRLETGRTHQIRVHLAEQARTPILADSLYGRTANDPDLRAIAETLGRQALHALVLGFRHPSDGRELRFEAPVPADMAEALEALRRLS